MKSRHYLGTLYIAELEGCSLKRISQISFVKKVMRQAVKVMNAQYVTSYFHQFSPYGISGVVIIAESHLAVHTWPEHRMVSIDLFTCNEKMKSKEALMFLKKSFLARKIRSKKMRRG